MEECWRMRWIIHTRYTVRGNHGNYGKQNGRINLINNYERAECQTKPEEELWNIGLPNKFSVATDIKWIWADCLPKVLSKIGNTGSKNPFGSPLASMVEKYGKPRMLLVGLSLKRLISLYHVCDGDTY